MLTNSILPIIIAFITASSVIGGECSGGNFGCNHFSRDACGVEWSAWCTVNERKASEFDSDCLGTVFCHELSEYQCKLTPEQSEYGGCTYTNSSHIANAVMISLTSVAVFLLLVTVFLLVKLTRMNKAKVANASVTATKETRSMAEPLLRGDDAIDTFALGS